MNLLANPIHLVKRFFSSLSNKPPTEADEQWAAKSLSERELKIWQQFSNPDKRHSIAVARGVIADIEHSTDASLINELKEIDSDTKIPIPVVAAALMHDCGKTIAGLGTVMRAFATVFWLIVADVKSYEWLETEHGTPGPNEKKSLLQRLALYRRYPELGAALLEEAESNTLVTAWAAEHHQPPSEWTKPLTLKKLMAVNDS